MKKKLPKIYIFLDQYNKNIFKNNSKNIGIIYRNYKSKKREVELNKIAKACKIKRYKLYVANNIKLAIKVKAEGVYIPAFNKTKKFLNLEKKNIEILGSAHNQKEIKEKISQRCKAIFLSPTFSVKKAKNYLGLHKFNFLSNSNKIKMYALGGINEKNINKLKILKTHGFGAIGLFKKKPAYKRPVFQKNNFL